MTSRTRKLTVGVVVAVVIAVAIAVVTLVGGSGPRVSATFLRYEQDGEAVVLQIANTSRFEIRYWFAENRMASGGGAVVGPHQNLQLTARIVPGVTNLVVQCWRDDDSIALPVYVVKAVLRDLGLSAGEETCEISVNLPPPPKTPLP